MFAFFYALLHFLTYVYLWLVKKDLTQSLIYAAILALLLGLRLLHAKRQARAPVV